MWNCDLESLFWSWNLYFSHVNLWKMPFSFMKWWCWYIFHDLVFDASTWKFMVLDCEIVKPDILWHKNVKCTIYFPWKFVNWVPLLSPQLSTNDWDGNCIHWNEKVFILTKFSSLAALEVSGAATDKYFIKMTTFLFQWLSGIGHSCTELFCWQVAVLQKCMFEPRQQKDKISRVPFY